jgi:hypothetical protein
VGTPPKCPVKLTYRGIYFVQAYIGDATNGVIDEISGTIPSKWSESIAYL